ncbi:MAG: hypothetical protein KIC91_08220 [Sutterella sp.]|nr:hypothetical protein [Sutterella sp.]
MTNSYLLPIKTNQEFAQARIFDWKRDFDFQLMVSNKFTPAFNKCFLSEDREIIVYVRGKSRTLDDNFLAFIKVEVERKEDLSCILKSLKILFPRSPIFALTPKTEYRKLKSTFRDVEFITQ